MSSLLPERYEALNLLLEKYWSKIKSTREFPTGIVAIHLKNGIAFAADLMAPNEIERVKTVLETENPLKQLVLAHKIGYKPMADAMEGYISHTQLSMLAEGKAPLTERVQAILRKYTGLTFEPETFVQKWESA